MDTMESIYYLSIDYGFDRNDSWFTPKPNLPHGTIYFNFLDSQNSILEHGIHFKYENKKVINLFDIL